jgi:hypothetical protein
VDGMGFWSRLLMKVALMIGLNILIWLWLITNFAVNEVRDLTVLHLKN